MADINELLGKTLTDITRLHDYDRLIFTCSDRSVYTMYHFQDCCEDVSIDDICGNLDELLGSPILMAEEVVSENTNPEGLTNTDESFTWTFYKIGTVKGVVTIRWYGGSNGYYSESVYFTLTTNPTED